MKVVENRNIESNSVSSLSQLLFPLPGIIFANIHVVRKETFFNFYKILFYLL